MVDRLQKLERLVTKRQPSDRVLVYFEEATDCYVQGISAVAVSLSRACLEQALRETIRLPTDQLKLEALITAADFSRLFHRRYVQMATEVRLKANEVLHRAGCSHEDAFDCIVKVRAVIEQAYGTAPDG